MQYFIYPLFLILYFELLGRWIFYKFDKKIFDFSFVLGFIVFLGVFYLISFPITVFHLSFKLLLAEYIIVFLLSIFLIVKDFKKISLLPGEVTIEKGHILSETWLNVGMIINLIISLALMIYVLIA